MKFHFLGTTIMSTPKMQDTTTEILTRIGGPSTEKPSEDTTVQSERTTTILMSTESKLKKYFLNIIFK